MSRRCSRAPIGAVRSTGQVERPSASANRVSAGLTLSPETLGSIVISGRLDAARGGMNANERNSGATHWLRVARSEGRKRSPSVSSTGWRLLGMRLAPAGKRMAGDLRMATVKRPRLRYELSDPVRLGKRYSVRDAARISGISTRTLRRWLVGEYGSDRASGPVFHSEELKSETPLGLSFIELIEVVIAAEFRNRRIKIERIRRGRDFMQREWGLQYPFAYVELDSAGGEILHHFDEQDPDAPALAVSTDGIQWTLPGLVRKRAQEFEHLEDDGFAIRWYPLGRNVPIMVDPRFAAGRPAVADRGVTVDIIKRRSQNAGQSVREIARDLSVTERAVEAALSYDIAA